MKVLGKNKIVETFHFPFSEALSFSILIWTVWGFVESFFWQRVIRFVDPGAPKLHHFIYIAAFLIYAGVATVMAAMIYSVTKWILFTMEKNETPKFRGITLCLILGVFFLAAIPFVYQTHLSRSAMPPFWLYAVTAVIVILASGALAFLYRKAAGLDFRIRRSGTTMMSVLVLSILLSFVSFPLFSGGKESEPQGVTLKGSIKRLMITSYLSEGDRK